MKKIVLIDGNALIFRAYYATATRMSRNAEGIPTNAIYLFSSILMKLLEQKNFDDIIVALDSPGKKFRHREFANYKANRKEVPAELKVQFAPIKEFLNLCNVKVIEVDGYEADDIIGTLAVRAVAENYFVDIYTGDRDLLQLINSNATIHMMRKGLSETEIFDRIHMKEVYGIEPKQIIDVKALMGDSSDNIPGVKGIGEKGAFDLIKKYNTLDQIYEAIDEIKGKLQEKLLQGKEMAYLSYELATIDTTLQLDHSLTDGDYQGYDKVGLNKFFKQYGIRSLLKYTEEAIDEQFNIQVCIVEKISSSLLQENSFIYVDIDQENYHYGTLRGIAIADEEKAEYIPFDFIFFDLDLLDYLASDTIKKNVFDSKKAFLALKKEKIRLNNIHFDILLAGYLLKQDFSTPQSLFFDYQIVIEQPNKNASLDELAKYALSIAKASVICKEKILTAIEEIHNTDLLYEMEQPLAIILAKMEDHGVLVDVELLRQLEQEYTTILDHIEQEIHELAGYDININSPKQLADLLYVKLQLPGNKKMTTTADDLKAIETAHPIVRKILEYRKYSKLLNTYIDSFNAYKFPDHRIHAMFNQSSTMTGRLSSSQPNLQNLSVRDEERMIIRKLIIAPEGYKILSLDYSQIELRLLAILSNDEQMLDAFYHDIDIHTATAGKIYNIPVEQVDAHQRRIAKAVNFGIVYGISAWGLSEQIGVSLAESKDIINKFFKTYPKVKIFLDQNVKQCEENGYVTTMFHRRRVVNEIHSSNYNLKEFGKRVAMNTPIQGSAADIIKLAMIQVDQYLKTIGKDCVMICQIHDELLFEVKEDKAEQIKEQIKNIMENILPEQKITLKVSYAIGNNWLEAK